MSFFVYVLYSPKFDKIYVGFSSDWQKRLESHNSLATKGWTTRFRPWSLIHLEYYETKNLAIKREKQLKGAKGRQWIRNVILKKK